MLAALLEVVVVPPRILVLAVLGRYEKNEMGNRNSRCIRLT